MGRLWGAGYDKGPFLADRVEVDTSMFSGNLGPLDDTVQKALETLDAGGGGGGSTTFIGLTDTPASWGSPGETLVVNASGDGLIFGAGATGYLTLDQTTPQTITGGAPIFSAGLDIGARIMDSRPNTSGGNYDLLNFFGSTNYGIRASVITVMGVPVTELMSFRMNNSVVMDVVHNVGVAHPNTYFWNIYNPTRFSQSVYLDTLKSKSILGTDADGKIIEGTHQSLAGYVPYTGATANVDLGTYNLTTTGNLAIRSDTGYLDLGATADDYKIQWDGSNAVHTITAGDFVFSGGKVGIGTSSPSELLHIKSTTTAARINIEAAANSDSEIRFTGDRTWSIQTDGNASIGPADYFHIYDVTASASRMIFDTSGNIKIPADSKKLYFGAADDYSIEFDGSDAVHTISAGDFVFTGGNVGIGTDSPGEKLHINGTVLSRYSESGAREVFFKAQPADALDTQFVIYNGTITNGSFYPGIMGYRTGAGNDYHNLTFYGKVSADADTGTAALLRFNGVRISGDPINGTNSAIQTRPIALFQNYGADLLKIMANGDIKIPADSKKLYLGAGDDAYIEYDGNSMNITADDMEITCDDLKINGSTGWSGTFTNGDGDTVTVTNGLITNVA
jgi:hypothetical protein